MAGAAGMKGDILNWLKKSKHIWIIPVYTVLYMLSFMFVEQSEVETHLIHSLVDDKIPFCEYFIIPYVIWYFFLIGSVLYFTFFNSSNKEYYQFLGTLGVGMTIFLIVSYVYPNGQNLRPELTGDSIFIQAVQFLYRIDTPTNIFPSMHVFNATAACVALFQNRRLRKHRVFSAATLALTVSIILSTMFLKQHSVADVMTALILNIICYQVFYRIIPANQEKIGRILTWKEIGTVPNLISAARLVLAVLFLGFFERYGLDDQKMMLTVFLIAAATTDFFDGRIARTFHQISRTGKILDPVSDKIMQGAILICLSTQYALAELVLILFLLKECIMLTAGWKVFTCTDAEWGNQWHGKLNTAVCYAVAMILLIGPSIPFSTANILIGASAVCMMMSLFMYIDEFRALMGRTKRPARRKMPERIRREA